MLFWLRPREYSESNWKLAWAQKMKDGKGCQKDFKRMSEKDIVHEEYQISKFWALQEWTKEVDL